MAEKIKSDTLPVVVGDIISCTLTDDTPTEFVVTDITDTYVRFESRNFIGKEIAWNEEGSNCGGYPVSDIRKYVDTEIWNILPEDLQAVISDVDRECLDRDGNRGTYTTKLFLPAASEVFNEDNCNGDKGLYKQLEYYKDYRNRIRLDEDGNAAWYWLASVKDGNSSNSTLVSGVYNGGASSRWSASIFPHVPVCFQISRK